MLVKLKFLLNLGEKNTHSGKWQRNLQIIFSSKNSKVDDYIT